MNETITADKTIRFEIKSQIATKEFELQKHENKYILGICAYGDWWDETFETLEEVKAYLKKEWNFEDLNFLNTIDKLNP